MDTEAVRPEGAGDLAVVDVVEGIDLRDDLPVEQVLDVLLEGQRLIVEYDHHDRQPDADGRLDVADVVAEAAVAGDADDLLVGSGELGPERRREGPAEGAVGSDEVPTGLACLGEGTGPGRGVAGIGDEHGIVGDLRIEDGHDGLRTHRAAIHPIVAGQVGLDVAPGSALEGQARRVGTRGARGSRLHPVGRLQHGLEEGTRIRDQPEFRREVQADHLRVDADVDEPGARVDELIRVGDHAAQPGPDGEDQIRVAQGRIGVLARVAADAADGQVVGLGDAALARVARRDGDPEPLGDLAQGVVRGGLVDAVAGDDDRPLGLDEGADDGFGVGGRHRRPVEGRFHGLAGRRRLVVGEFGLEDVVGDPEVDGARRAADRLAGGLADEPGRVARDRGLGAPLGHRREQGRLVELLVLLAEALRAPHGRRQGDDRAARPVGLGQCAGHVGRSGSVGTVDEGRSSAQPGIGVGHVDRGCLAACQDLADPELLHGDPERVVAARHEEEVLDADRLQFVCDRGGRRGGRGCGCRRRDGRDGIHRDRRGDHRVPQER